MTRKQVRKIPNGRHINFRYYTCSKCNYSRTWPWPSKPESEGLVRCDRCGAPIKWIMSCIPDR